MCWQLCDELHSQDVRWGISIKSNHFCQTFESNYHSPLCIFSTLMSTWYSRLRYLHCDHLSPHTYASHNPNTQSHRLAPRLFPCYMPYLIYPPILSPPCIFCLFLWPCLSGFTPFGKNLITTPTWVSQKLGELVLLE